MLFKMIEIPNTIDDNEKIVRFVFSPINVNKKGKLKPNAFKSPAGIDEVSVNRLDYTTADHCKQLAKKIENHLNKRAYFGLGVLLTSEIRAEKAEVVYSPIVEKERYNPFHADIKIGCIRKKGESLPAEYNFIVNNLTKKARLYSDPNPLSDNWEGDELA